MNNFVFRTYCEHPTILNLLEDGYYPKFLRYAMQDCAHQHAILKPLENNIPILVGSDMTSSKADVGFIYYENNSLDKML